MGDGLIRRRPYDWKPVFTYTGTYEWIDDGNENWRIKFKSNGVLTWIHKNNAVHGIDVFLVGGGAGGYPKTFTHGGGGGYTRTIKNVPLLTRSYSIQIGTGGAQGESGNPSIAFGYQAAGGNANGDGGSGGGENGRDGNGGSDGYNGGQNTGDYGGDRYGIGQRQKPGPNGETGSTREFGEANGTLYAGGGGGAPKNNGGAGGGGRGAYLSNDNETYYPGANGGANTGGGGGQGYGLPTGKAGSGGSGIVVIRNAREMVR